MSNFFKNFLDSMKLTEDDDFTDDFLETEKKDRKTKRLEKKAAKEELEYGDFQNNQAPVTPIANNPRKERSSRGDKGSVNKVIPIRTTARGLEVCIMKPTSFEDSQEICDILLTGRAVVINLEGFDEKLAQRTMDFVSGSVYAINGRLHRISNCIFIISPDTIDISGDYLDIVQETGFEPPTFHNEF
ncbi:MAG: cell division protein SepF [Clostridiales bacterium]|nr:cell division protein SepF [Clostridiales bacterium]